MSFVEQSFDIVVFGATGFTGRRVAALLAKICSEADDAAKSEVWRPSWAIAGRSRSKLESLFGSLDPTPDGAILADVRDEGSLLAMAETTRLILNCTGPFRHLGAPVVKACIDSGTDYIDLCGEPYFIENMHFHHNSAAEKAGCMIISACAFDSVPADIGTMLAAAQLENCDNVSLFHTLESVGRRHLFCALGHATTWECAVHGFGAAAELRQLRRRQRKAEETHTRRASSVGPKKLPFWESRIGSYALRFPGADAACVRLSQRSLRRRFPGSQFPHFEAYFCVRSSFWLGIIMLLGVIFGILARFQLGRRILIRFPRIFSLGAFSEQGPTERSLATTRFRTHLFAQGEGGQCATIEVSGPEPGYVSTPIIFIAVARTILEARCDMAGQGGGIFTPGGALGGGRAIEVLVSNCGELGVHFTITR